MEIVTKIVLILLVLYMSCKHNVEARTDGKLQIGGANVCKRVFTYNSYVYLTKYYTGYDNYRTCCKKLAWVCTSRCTKSRSKQMKYVHSKLHVRSATSVFCCPGWARIRTATDCQQAICNPRCINGDCVKPNVCKCKSGFTGTYCEKEINECLSSPCEQICTNIRGDYACSCKKGFRKVISNHTSEMHSPRCENIDECKINEDLMIKDGDTNRTQALCKCVFKQKGCKASCHNTVGSYKCSCSSGYRLVANRVCTDDDECRLGTHQCQHICLNQRNGYSCTCYPGYRLDSDGKTCNDINECSVSNGGCEQICTNTLGSFECSCKKGFLLLGDNYRCQDINECQIGRPCDRFNGYCINFPGRYQCGCNPGYELDLLDRKTCTDVDECKRSNDCQHFCYNIDGGYACGCRHGYLLQSDGRTCQDLNECADEYNGCEQICENTPGSFKCKCKQGFTLNYDGQTCRGLPCQTLYSPPHGSIKCDGHNVGDRCTYSCDLGFQLIGQQTRTCLNRSVWEVGNTKCEAMQCPAATPPQNGILTLPCVEQYRSKCLVKCKQGYDLVSGGQLIDCNVNQQQMTYWNKPTQCQEISQCKPNPCKNSGRCQVISKNSYICDCSNTGYQGDHCQNGVIKVPEIPQLAINTQTDDLYIRAKPKKSLIFKLVAEPSDAVIFSPSNVLTLYAPLTEITFQITTKIAGVVRIQYQISGDDFVHFLQPAESIVLVKGNSKQGSLTAVPDNNLMDENTYQKALDQCLDGTKLSLKSSCHWKLSGSSGYVSVQSGSINIPISLAGITFQNRDGSQTFKNSGVMTVARETQNMLVNQNQRCNANLQHCKSPSSNCIEHDFVMKRNHFVRSYLTAFSIETPWWLRLSLPNEYSGFHVNDIQSLLVKDGRIKELKCPNIPNQLNGVYAASVFQAPVEVNLLDRFISMESAHYSCFLKSLCNNSQTFVSFPKDVTKEITKDDSKLLSLVSIQGFGVDSRKPLQVKCWNVRASDSTDQQVCINANVWAKGSVNLKTSKVDVQFNGEMFVESDNLHKLMTTRFNAKHKFYLTGKTTAAFDIKVHGSDLKFLFRDKQTEIMTMMGGAASTLCDNTGVQISYNINDLEIDYSTSVLRFNLQPDTKLTARAHYNINKGSVTGIKNLNTISSITRYMDRSLGRRISFILNSARKYPVIRQALSKTSSSLVKKVKELSYLVSRGKPTFEDVFTRLEDIKMVGMSFTDALVAVNDAVANKESSSISGRTYNFIRGFQKLASRLYNLKPEAETEGTIEKDNGLSINLIGELCVYQLCFKNNEIEIQDLKTSCQECVDMQYFRNLDPKDFVLIKMRSRKTKQFGETSGIRIAKGSVATLAISKVAGINGQLGDIRMSIPAITVFFGNVHNVTISINQSSFSYQLKNVTFAGTDFPFNVKVNAPFNPATTWNSIRFKYKASPSSGDLKQKMETLSDSFINGMAKHTTKRIQNATDSLNKAKTTLSASETNLEDLKKDYEQKRLKYLKSESDYQTNKTVYERVKKEFRGYFSLKFYKEMQSNLSNGCKFEDCQDVCHTMRLYDLCQKSKTIEAKEMRCFQQRTVDRTTVLEDFKNMCDLTKRNFRTIYTGTCQAGKQQKLQGSLTAIGTGIGSFFGPVGAGVGAAVGYVLSRFSSCDTSYEVIKEITNYQVACTQKKSTTRVKIFFVTKCNSFPVNVHSEFTEPEICKVTNTSCIQVTDGACMSRNVECRKRRDVERKKILGKVGAFKNWWADLDGNQTKLDSLWIKKDKANIEMMEAKRLYERQKTIAVIQKRDIKRFQNLLDNVYTTLTLEKCVFDFQQRSNRSKFILKFSDIKFETDVSNRENILLELAIDGDDYQGKQKTRFVWEMDDPDAISLERNILRMVQNYLCKQHTKRRRRSITEMISPAPLGRHDDFIGIDLPHNVTDHQIHCLHAKTILDYLQHVVKSFVLELEATHIEYNDLSSDVRSIETVLKRLKTLPTNELIQDQIELLQSAINTGRKSLSTISPDEVLTSWKLKMEIYTTNNNFTACLNFEDCLDVAFQNLYRFPNSYSVTRHIFLANLDNLKESILGVQQTQQDTFRQLEIKVNKTSLQFLALENQLLYCESAPKVKLNSPGQIDALRSQKLILQCSAESKTKLSFAWKRNDEILPFEKTDKLAIYVDQSTEGQYRCIAWNQFGNSTSNSTLVVLRQKPVVLKQPESVTYLLTQTKVKPTFICNVTGDPLPKIFWYHQPFQQKTSLKLQERKPILTLKTPTLSSSGFYYCFVGNKFGSVYSKKARLDIVKPILPNQKISMTFDLSIGNVEKINKTSYKENLRNTTSTSNEKFNLDLESSGEKKVKFEVNFEENDTRIDDGNSLLYLDSIADDGDDLTMVKTVSNKRFTLSNELGSVVSKLERLGNNNNKDSDEIKNSMVIGFDGNRCPNGHQLHSNGYACVACTPGSFEWNRKCLQCAIGTYQSQSGMTSCDQCMDHKVTETVGSTSPSDCIDPVLSKIDIAFVLETSSHVKPSEFTKIKQTLMKFINEYVLSTKTINFCLITFSNVSTVKLGLKDKHNHNYIQQEINNLQLAKSQDAITDKAILQAFEILIKQGSPSNRKIIVPLLKSVSSSKTINKDPFVTLRNTMLTLQHKLNDLQIIPIAYGLINNYQNSTQLNTIKALATFPKDINSFVIVQNLNHHQLLAKELASKILKGQCGVPSFDIAIAIEVKKLTNQNLWEVTADFVHKIVTKMSSIHTNVNSGLVLFNDKAHSLLKVSRHGPDSFKSHLKRISNYQQSDVSGITNTLDFVYNDFLTEKHGSLSKHKILIAFTDERITDDQLAAVQRKYPQERVLFFNVILKYTKQDVGISDFGVEESIQSVYSLSELTELTGRMTGEIQHVNNHGCHIDPR